MAEAKPEIEQSILATPLQRKKGKHKKDKRQEKKKERGRKKERKKKAKAQQRQMHGRSGSQPLFPVPPLAGDD